MRPTWAGCRSPTAASVASYLKSSACGCASWPQCIICFHKQHRGRQDTVPLWLNVRLQAESGEIIEIVAALEKVSTVYNNDPVLMARACYHLGNRHVPLQMGSGFLRYKHDHVLDDMLRRLGLHINQELAPFEPETGAYGGHQHVHGHHH